MTTFNIQDAIKQAAEQGPDMNEVQKGGGSFEYQPPAEGVCLATLIGYIETGEVYDEKYSKTKNCSRVCGGISRRRKRDGLQLAS